MSGGTDPEWRVDERHGARVVRCAALSRLPGIRHGFSTRGDSGRAGFDLGSHDDRDPEVVERRRRFLAAAGLADRRPTLLKQVHGATVVDAAGDVDGIGADAAVSVGSATDRAPSVRWADCVPVLLAAADGSAVAAVHSGWRGTAAGVAAATIDRLAGLGIAPADLVAALGPAIGACCYAVGEEVPPAVARAAGVEPGEITRPEGDRLTLDLGLAVRHQLANAGIPASSIHVAPWCTACAAELFFSYRREGAAAGRQMASIGRVAPGSP